MKLAYDVFVPKNVTKDLAPIVLIHGLIETRKTWKNIAPEIARNTGRTVYAIDCRNHGNSPWCGEHSSTNMASDLNEFLSQHQIPKIVLVGHSMGGVVAMMFALKEPKKVEKLLVEDSPAKRSTHSSDNLVSLTVTLIKEGLASLPSFKDEKAMFDCMLNYGKQLQFMFKATPSTIDSYDLKALPMHFDGEKIFVEINIDGIVDAVMKDKLVQHLSGTYEGDALFMYGFESQFKVDQDTLINKHFPRAIKFGFENAGHFIHQTFPKEFTREVSNFINSGNRPTAKL